MNKHTPGPWRCTKYPKVFSINATSGRQIAIMTEHHGDCPMVPMFQFERSEQDAADACLIAASPEMFELLKSVKVNRKLLNDEHFSGVADRLFALIDTVISKAEGNS